MPSEGTPLLWHRFRSGRSRAHRLAVLVGAEGEPSWIKSYQGLLFGSYLNLLLMFIPLSFLSHYLDWDATQRFSFSFLATIPLAKLLREASDQLALRLRPISAGLLSVSFSNAVEIITSLAALFQGELRVAQVSILGYILSNILLVLGISFIGASFKQKESKFQVTGTQLSASLMTLSCITLLIPAAYQNTQDGGAQAALVVISRGTAVLLLGVYVAYLFFRLKTHPDLFRPENKDEEEGKYMNAIAAGFSLFSVTIVTVFCVYYLVASIEGITKSYAIPKPFISLVLLPIAAHAADYIPAVYMAMKGRMSTIIMISFGSSIRIVAFVAPLLVIIGWIAGKQLTLFFTGFEATVLFSSVLLVNTLIKDGRSNYMEGIMLIAIYLIIALALWVT